MVLTRAMKKYQWIVLSVVGLLLGSCSFTPKPSAPEVAGTRTLVDALNAAVQDGNAKDRALPCFLPVLTEEIARQGLDDAIALYDRKTGADPVLRHWKKHYRPIYQQIAKTGQVPPNVSFQVGRITRQGGGVEEKLLLRLDIHKISAHIPGCSLPIVRYNMSWKFSPF